MKAVSVLLHLSREKLAALIDNFYISVLWCVQKWHVGYNFVSEMSCESLIFLLLINQLASKPQQGHFSSLFLFYLPPFRNDQIWFDIVKKLFRADGMVNILNSALLLLLYNESF